MPYRIPARVGGEACDDRRLAEAHGVGRGSLDGFEVVSLACHDTGVEASFAPAVGMIGASLRHRGDELLGQRRGLGRYAESGSTMGIPLLHPWANRLSRTRFEVAGREVRADPESPLVRLDPSGLPIHGLVNASPHWEVEREESGPDGARLDARLDFGARPELLAAFPFPHELRVSATVSGATLTLRTVLAATGDAPVPVSFGYHPYFTLPGVPRAEWHVEIPVRRRLVLDERMIPTGATEPASIAPGPLGDRGFDDGYADLDEPARFVLAGGGREIAVVFEEGYGFAQVYAPPDRELICFEPMTAPTNALVTGETPIVEPGGDYTATFSVTVA